MNKKVMAACGGLAAFGVLTAAAASLGGLSSSSLGADQTVVASCDSDGMVLSYTNTYSATPGTYTVSAVVATGVASTCSAKNFNLTLSGTGGTSLGAYSGTVSLVGTTLTITTTSTVVAASSVVSAALVITG
jgi:hypothetical protein